MPAKNPIDQVPEELIAEHRARYKEYLKSNSEPLLPRKKGMDRLVVGGAAACGELWNGHDWQYCRGPRFCRAERTKYERTGITTDDSFGGGNPR